MEQIPFGGSQKLDLRVGEIRKVEEMDGFEKLYKLMVDLGKGKLTTLVAGVKLWYSIEELIGKQTVVVVNLEPKEIGGVTSEGMLLCADLPAQAGVGGGVVLINPEKEVPVGARVR